MASPSYPLLFSVLLLLLLSLSSAAHRQHHRRPAADAAAAVSDKIQKACKATRYPVICQSALSQAPNLPSNPTPNDLILASISTSSTNLKTAQSKAQSILDASASDLNRTNAAKNCLQLLSFSDRRLSAASRAVGGAALADARAWGSAALLYQYDCWSALKYVNGTNQVADAMTFLVYLTNLTSNALSMVTALQRYGPDTSTWGPPQTERDGYWGDGGATSRTGPIGSQNGVPTDLVPSVSVCREGCKYRTVQSAVDAAPAYGSGRFVVYIKEGVYKETVRVPFEKTNVVFLGDGMGKTVITGSLNADTVGVSTYNTATVGVSGDGFMASNLTFSNTAGPDAHQAVAFLSDSDRSILETVEFIGHQDTLYAHSLRQLYKSCRISGTVDFVFGNSAAVFQDSLILIVPRQLNPAKGERDTVTAQGRTDPAQSTGFVFYNSVVNGSADYLDYYRQKPAVHKSYLGRPWKEYSRTVFIDCYLEVIIRPEGWLAWSGDFALSTLFYGEFKSKGPGGHVTGRVPWSSQIPEEHLDVYSVQNFIQLA